MIECGFTDTEAPSHSYITVLINHYNKHRLCVYMLYNNNNMLYLVCNCTITIFVGTATAD